MLEYFEEPFTLAAPHLATTYKLISTPICEYWFLWFSFIMRPCTPVLRSTSAVVRYLTLLQTYGHCVNHRDFQSSCTCIIVTIDT